MVDNARLNLYVSHADRCGYLDSQLAVNLFADPRAPMTAERYSLLVRHGFRRSGDLVYRPHCPSCQACVPLRIPVDRFRPNRSQRRTLAMNRDLDVRIGQARYSSEQFLLYDRYLHGRHPGGGMDNASRESFRQFLGCSWQAPWFVEFRLQGRLVCVAVCDLLDDGLSAVYSFYDPALRKRGLGVNAILWQIDQVRRLRRQYLYLGYWIEQSPKMAYKADFQPAEVFRDPIWVDNAHFRPAQQVPND